MRAGFLALTLATAVAGCDGSLTDPDHAGGADGGRFCPRPLGDDCSAAPLQIAGDVCTLEMGIQSACGPCGPAGATCPLRGAVVRGAMYTYLQITNVDVAFVFVYDTNGALVAKLLWSANGAAMGLPWTCAAGPDNFNANEAISLLPVTVSGDLGGMCP